MEEGEIEVIVGEHVREVQTAGADEMHVLRK
jgi:hypothetical protein